MARDLEYYMNEPDLINEPMPMREVYAIKHMIYDEIKDMSFDERSAYFRRDSSNADKFGWNEPYQETAQAYQPKQAVAV
ncbi:MAG: hypothetical protein LBM98_06790 [Oscillospiraceae bacterium]|jgi:hypothetical protein|nr:hypothetical protein [Oscillospiraceae bacterium]